MIRFPLSALLAASLLAGCNSDSPPPPPAPDTQTVSDAVEADAAMAEARRIAHDYIIVDTHVDVPYRLEENPADVSAATDDGDFDYPRAVTGGLNAPFMSIYTSAETADSGESFDLANRLIDEVEALIADHPDKFATARSPADVRARVAEGLIALPLGMENGSPLEGKLENLRYFFDRGIRYITLAHSKSNQLSDSSYDSNKQWDGLSDTGIAVVREMNRLGMMVDVSHLSDAAFYDVLEVSTAPVIASHSSARHFTPGFERNMSDDMIRALAEHDGIIMINFGSSFLTESANRYMKERGEAAEAYRAEHPEVTEQFMETEFPKQYAVEHGEFPFATLDELLDHFDHVRDLVGVEYLGIGSDFDGVGDSLPIDVKDVAAYPNIVAGLRARGYSEADIRLILGENLLRVWAAIESHADAGA
jgi:membrane dipeptidase